MNNILHLRKNLLIVCLLSISGSCIFTKSTNNARASEKIQVSETTEKSKSKTKKKQTNNLCPSQETKKQSSDEATNGKVFQVAKLYDLDRIEAVIFGPESVEIITTLDSKRSSFDGKKRTIDEVIVERLMYLDAMRYKIIPSEQTVDKYLDSIKKQHHLTAGELKQQFEQGGYTVEEGRLELGRMYAINHIVDYKIRSRLIVPEKKVVEYYNEHPEFQEATLLIERAFIRVSKQEREKMKKDLQEFIKTGKGFDDLEWITLPIIKEHDLAEDKYFLTQMQAGDISEPQEVSKGFELFRLKEKTEERLVSLEQRYPQIAELLMKPEFEERLADYRKQLLDSASILRF